VSLICSWSFAIVQLHSKEFEVSKVSWDELARGLVRLGGAGERGRVNDEHVSGFHSVCVSLSLSGAGSGVAQGVLVHLLTCSGAIGPCVGLAHARHKASVPWYVVGLACKHM